MVPGETVWDLYARDLQAPPFSLDANTALEITTRLVFLGSQALTSWYTCAVGGGCGATGGYMLFLAADDDDGNIANGTPHMTAIRAAFERHEIHCATPAPVNSGCAGGPTAAPTVTATPTDGGVDLSWSAVPGAARYYVFRAEGVSGCDTGKAKVGDVTGTTFSDVGLLGGRPYSYVVIPVGGEHVLLRPRQRLRLRERGHGPVRGDRGLHAHLQPGRAHRQPGRERDQHLHGAVVQRRSPPRSP